jgi:hypothetical protein
LCTDTGEARDDKGCAEVYFAIWRSRCEPSIILPLETSLADLVSYYAIKIEFSFDRNCLASHASSFAPIAPLFTATPFSFILALFLP